MAQSVERLKAATRRSVFSAMAKQEAVGTVEQSRVSLQRVIPLVRNSFKPFFRGRFIEKDGRVLLVGRFAMHPLAKAFMTFWFAALGLFVLLTCVQAARHPQNNPFAPLFAIGMIAAGIALVRAGKWFARNDAAWLSDVIRGALCGGPGAQAAPTALPDQPSTPLTFAAVILAAGGATYWALALFGQHFFKPNGPNIMEAIPALSAPAMAALGSAFLALAWGVWRRHAMAWRAGFVLLAGGWLYSSVLALATDTVPSSHRVGAVAFCIAGLFVTIVWMRWWRAQRVHFPDA
jgi:hypothetical protein